MKRKFNHGTIRTCLSWVVFSILLTTYWVTTPSTVSYWDCPEYVSAAYLLEIGHPPGNPTWMLVERICAMLAPSPQWAAYAINLSSGLFSAFAGLFLCRIIFQLVLWLLRGLPAAKLSPVAGASVAATVGSLCFGWCDSVWYSAVEAEVYAMSIFFTLLCTWLMVKWSFNHDWRKGNRLLVLIAYLFGLSIGVHQLNLLCIPALMLIWCLRRGVRNKWRICGVILSGMIAVGLILIGMMPSTIHIAANLELFCINTLHLPYLSGVVVYILMLGTSLLIALAATARSHNRGMISAAIFPALFLSGLFCFGDHLMIGAAISAIVALLIVRDRNFNVRRLNLAIWMLAMLLCGYGSYALIPVRGDIPSPANPAMPGDPFSFASYQAREQYGAPPLLYGPTPLSRPLYVEEFLPGTDMPVYRKYALIKGNAKIFRDPDGHGYQVKGYQLRNVFAPEMNVWFPRVHSRDPRDLPAYKSWAGCDTASMTKVAVSYAVDSVGRPVMKKRFDGSTDSIFSYKPTLRHNVRMLLGYQIGYMYFRYLMWNFCGRQNDMHSQGEVEHGNFITGFTPVDNLMLGAEDQLPDYMGEKNPGRNKYYAIPFILGIIGIIWLFWTGNRGIAIDAVVFLLFFMTGLAIVIYLNQAPGEPRERDYSFIGSYAAFSIWIGFGTVAILRLCRARVALLSVILAMIAVPGWMCAQNFDDHDRRGRNVATSLAVDMLENLEPNAILFVNGDNYTFPLWYVQEVLGVRTDVRVVNLAYMSMPQYIYNLCNDWRKSPRINSLLDRNDIVRERYRHTVLSSEARDTLPASVVLENLQQNDTALVTTQVAQIELPSGSVCNLNMSELANGSSRRNISFIKLMMFNLIASNPDRPVYWLKILKHSDRLNVGEEMLRKNLFAYQLDTVSSAKELNELARQALSIDALNSRGRNAYMDGTPARMIGMVRSNMVLVARDLMLAGEIEKAVKVVDRADIALGDNVMSYNFIHDGDSILDVRHQLGYLQLSLADSLLNYENDSIQIELKKSVKSFSDDFRKVRAIELKARGEYNIREAAKRVKDFRHYRESLPPHLRSVTTPLY